MSIVLRIFLCCTAGLAICSCGTPTNLVFHQNTVLGVDASTAATEAGHTRIVVGYDRETTAFVPKSEVDAEPGSAQLKDVEAMSAISLSTIKIKGLGQTEVHERFATGAAARNVARQQRAVESFADAPPSQSPSPSGGR